MPNSIVQKYEPSPKIKPSGHWKLSAPGGAGRHAGRRACHSPRHYDRRKAEEALANSEALYRLLADNITEHIWIMDLNLSLRYISPSVEKLYGYTAQEIKNLSLKKLFTKESYKKILETFSAELPRAMASEPPPPDKRFILELQAIHADGHLLWIENHLSFIRDENGKPVSIMGETVDITDRKNVQDKLLEEEQRFRALADQSSDIIIMVNREGIVTYENPSVSILGFNSEERLGNHAFELLHPDDLETITRAFNLLFGDKNASVQKSEIRLRHRDGSWRTFEAMGSNLVRNNIIETAIVNLRDITDPKQSEEALKKAKSSTVSSPTT
jgi:PAS domain S-box-containing protein